MNKTVMRIFCLVLAAILCLGLLAGIIPAHAASTVSYRYGSSSGYSNVVYNWGERGETATFLSPMALQFYAENNVSYGQLAALAGSASTSNVPSSALYTELKRLMSTNHTKQTSYGDTRYLFPFTDCMNNGYDAVLGNKISSFYSGVGIGPSWDGGSTWNREHTWPNSKGDASGNGENDIIMLRPTSSSENSSRGNKAYGETAGTTYYDPNSKSGGAYDLHGDVARIMLFVYVRWGNTVNMWGAGGVMESKEVLLKWAAEDPVDTWEMGRNDSVESITGTRNVFVDYPELIFELFEAEIPEGLPTPSNGMGGSGVTPQPPAEPTGPKAQLMTSAPAAGDVVVIYNSGMAMTATDSSGKLAGEGAALYEDRLPITDTMAQLTVGKEGTYYVFTLDGKYLTSAATGNGLSFQNELTDCGKWTIAAAGTNAWNVTNVGAAYNGSHNQALETYQGKFTTYGLKDDAIYQMRFYQVKEENEDEDPKNGWIEEDGKWYYYQNNAKVTNKWMQDSTGWCYLGADGAMVTNAWAKDGSGWRWLDASGYMVYSQWVEDGGNKYYVNAGGYRVTGEQTIDGKSCYFDENGVYKVRYTVTFKNDNGTVLSTKLYFEGETVQIPADPTKAADANYTYTFAGWDKTVTKVTGDATYTATYTKTKIEKPAKNGWIMEGGKWYYYENDVKATNKWAKDGTGWCYLDANGQMVTGRWVKDSIGWRYVDANGYMVTNRWIADSVGWCYVGGDGYMITNAWAKDSQGWCWIGDAGYIVYSQWIEDAGNRYYVNSRGYRVTGEHTIDGESCYFDENGVYKVRYTVTFKNDNGTVLSTKLYFEGETVQIPADPTKAADANYTYTFAGWDKTVTKVTGDATYTATYTKTERPAGSQHGWIKENGKWYYYEQGVMVTNKWKKDSKGWCYLGADGAMVTNRWIKDSVGWCYVGADGYCVTNAWKKDSTGWCYLDANGRMVYSRWVADSYGWCYVGANGYMVTNAWAKDSQGWYWMGADGYAIKNTSKIIDGKRYYFNASGLCTNP